MQQGGKVIQCSSSSHDIVDFPNYFLSSNISCLEDGRHHQYEFESTRLPDVQKYLGVITPYFQTGYYHRRRLFRQETLE